MTFSMSDIKHTIKAQWCEKQIHHVLKHLFKNYLCLCWKWHVLPAHLITVDILSAEPPTLHYHPAAVETIAR